MMPRPPGRSGLAHPAQVCANAVVLLNREHTTNTMDTKGTKGTKGTTNLPRMNDFILPFVPIVSFASFVFGT
jgi:hypothetical protein